MSQPAFPCDLTAYDEEVKQQFQGMTLRDYFAAKAMQSELLDRNWKDIKSLALYVYDIADAMMKARDGNS